MRALLRLSVILALTGCDSVTEPVIAPELGPSSVAPLPGNVLGALVSARVRLADSLLVRYGIAGAALDQASPASVPAAEDVLLPVLGLRPDTHYALQVVAFGSRVVAGDTLRFTTGSLPDDLPAYQAGGSDPSPGYVVIAAGSYGLVLDNSGRVVWYHRFPGGPGLNFQAQPNGRFVARPPPEEPGAPASWVELDALGNVIRTLTCADGLQPRFHDLIAQPDGSYWILCDETRSLDLSAAGGPADARVTGTAVQHRSAEGAVLFRWSPFDHVPVEPDPADMMGVDVNWTHGNALDLDGDGNLVLSFRNLSQIIKVDTRTGKILWRMGGPGNEFVFRDGPRPFARQHGVRVAGPDRIILLDNLGDPAGSRVERYGYDPVQGTAWLEASQGSEPAVVAALGGTAQPLAGGRTLVSFGNGGRVEEYDADGHVVWRVESPGYVFRAQRIRSLYTPGAGAPR